MSSKKSGRVLVAAALVAALFLAVPVTAGDGPVGDGPGAPQGLVERLAAWFFETWMADGLAGGGNPATDDSQSTTTNTTDDEDPEGCRDYAACVDPNG